MTSQQKKIKVAFFNPPHADWSLANNTTYTMVQSHYSHYGKYFDKFEWIESPYKYNQYNTIEDIYNEAPNADIYMFSSYAWNYDLCDQLAEHVKNVLPNAITIVGGPHIGGNDQEFLKSRVWYDYICQATKPGEVFMEDFLNAYIDTNGKPDVMDISWEMRSLRGTSCAMPDYSVYEEHFDYYKKTLDYAKEHKLEPFVVLETTRGCPYQCVYCEWGGGINTKILKKKIEVVKRDIVALKKAGFRDAYLTDANFGVFEDRDLEIFAFAWNIQFNLTDISTLKSKDIKRRKRLIDRWFEIVGTGLETHSVSEGGTDMWGETEFISVVPTVSIQSISDEAMKVSKRVDLSTEHKLELSKHIEKRCREEGFPVPALELILAMPGSTIDDFYNEFEVIWNFQAWGSFRHDYMFLPDSTLSQQVYKDQYDIKTVKVYTDLVDEDGVDNWRGLYKTKKSYFETIRSCYSFTASEMVEMWIMNHAGNMLMRDIYPKLQDIITPPEYGRLCYSILKQLPGFDVIYNEVVDIFDPDSEPRSIKRLCGQLRTDVLEEFVKNAHPVIYSEVYKSKMEDPHVS